MQSHRAWLLEGPFASFHAPLWPSCDASFFFLKREALHFSFARGPTNLVAEISPGPQTSGSAPDRRVVLSTSSPLWPRFPRL